ncbi:MAG: 4Fe-4S binding protein [Synergistaceae bacterium]|nr:4Fe-4S binding protein [Synergistaceae bacterium]
MLISTGIPVKEDLEKARPSAERLVKGPVAMVECFQEIPCNPCVAACTRKAISMYGGINSVPEVDFEKCTGCSMCITHCPGLAIFVIDQSYSDAFALVKIPFEYVPVPKAGQFVVGLDRSGEELGWFHVNRITSGGRKNMTNVIALEVPKGLSMEVRDIKVGGYRDVE